METDQDNAEGLGRVPVSQSLVKMCRTIHAEDRLHSRLRLGTVLKHMVRHTYISPYKYIEFDVCFHCRIYVRVYP